MLKKLHHRLSRLSRRKKIILLIASLGVLAAAIIITFFTFFVDHKVRALTRPRIEVPSTFLNTYRDYFNDSRISYQKKALLWDAAGTNSTEVPAEPADTFRSRLLEKALVATWPTPSEPTSGGSIPGSDNALKARLDWLATGGTADEDDLDRENRDNAIQWLTTVVSWEPSDPSTGYTALGTDLTLYERVDRAREAMKWIACSYDSLYNDLSSAQKTAVRDNLAIRTGDFYDAFTDPERPPDRYVSHFHSATAWFAPAALALKDDVAEADTWLNWVVNYYQNDFPRWGGPDGGWSEGVAYHIAGIDDFYPVAESLKEAEIADLFSVSWFQNAISNVLYLWPVETTRPSSFGDGSGNLSDWQATVGRYAVWIASTVTGDTNYLWWAENVHLGQWKFPILSLNTSANMYFLTRYLADNPTGTAPTNYDKSKHFSSNGTVSFHQNLADPDNDVSLNFKATPAPLTSVSHGHGDQNSFVIHAYKEPLAISGGYYDDLGYPLPRSGLTLKSNVGVTANKNSLLFDDIGQYYSQFRSFDEDPTVTASIEKYEDNNTFAYTVGEAAGAYSDVEVSRFRRYAVMVRKDSFTLSLPYFVIVDDTTTPQNRAVSWLLQAGDEMTLDETARTVLIESDPRSANQVRLYVKLLPSDNPTGFDQTGVANSDPSNVRTRGNWHFNMTLPSATQTRIAAVLVPYKQSDLDANPNLLDDFENITADGLTSGNELTLRVGSDSDQININFTNDTVTVAEANDAPVLASPGNKSVTEKDTLTFTVTATDADNDSLTYSASNLPSGASFDTSTRTFYWTPNDTQAGTYSVTFSASDGKEGGTDSKTITITVADYTPSTSTATTTTSTTTTPSATTATTTTTPTIPAPWYKDVLKRDTPTPLAANYLIIDNGKYKIDKSDMGRFGFNPNYIQTDDSIKNTPDLGTLHKFIKGSDSSTIYLMSGGTKHYIPDPETLRGLGFSWSQLTTLPQSTVDTISSGSNIVSPWYRTSLIQEPTPTTLFGRLIRRFRSPPTYLIANGCKYTVNSAAMRDFAFDTRYAHVDETIKYWSSCGNLPNLIRDPTGAVYAVTGGAKHYITSPQVLQERKYRGKPIINLPQVMIDSMATGPSISPAPTRGIKSWFRRWYRR